MPQDQVLTRTQDQDPRSRNPTQKRGRSAPTAASRSSASPARNRVPSSNSRPMRVTPCGTRRGGLNVGSGLAGSGAQSVRASLDVHESGAQGQRRVAGVVGHDQRFIAERGHEQHVHLLEMRSVPRRTGAASGRPGRSRPPRRTATCGGSSAIHPEPGPAAAATGRRGPVPRTTPPTSQKRIGISEPCGGWARSNGDRRPSRPARHLQRRAIDRGRRSRVHPRSTSPTRRPARHRRDVVNGRPRWRGHRRRRR